MLVLDEHFASTQCHVASQVFSSWCHDKMGLLPVRAWDNLWCDPCRDLAIAAMTLGVLQVTLPAGAMAVVAKTLFSCRQTWAYAS
jgi:hypothetical protein